MLDPHARMRFALAHAMGTTDSMTPPPLGSWPRFYALAAVLAVGVLLLLWWFTRTYNIPLPPK